jgi:hypothetical protein
MNLRNELKNPTERGFIDILVLYVTENPDNFEELYWLMFDTDKTVAWRAGWACDKISRINHEWFTPKHIQKILNIIPIENHNGLRREFLSIINNLYSTEILEVNLINQLFEWMISPHCDVSHQVLSMKILCKFCKNEPGFIPELLAYLESVSPGDYTPGFNVTRKKVVKWLINNRLRI